jgi:hypothetical protein
VDGLSLPLGMDLLTACRLRKNDHRLIEDFVTPVLLQETAKRTPSAMKNKNGCLRGIYLQGIKIEDGEPFFYACSK